MLFNGTEKYPGNEITDALQSIGVEFGPDINAYTSYDETVYMLDLVIDEEEDSVGTAFRRPVPVGPCRHHRSRGCGSEERGIVRDEYRLGIETSQARASFSMYSTGCTDQGTPYEGSVAPVARQRI